MKRYCEDCRFFGKSPLGNAFASCTHPKAKKRDGMASVARDLDQAPLCHVERMFGDACGPQAVRFEAKTSVAA